MNPRADSPLVLDELPSDTAAAPTAVAPVVLDDTPAVAAVVITEDDELGSELPERASRNPDGSITLTLRTPIPVQQKSSTGQIKNEDVTSFTFHRLNGADIRAVQSTSDDNKPIVLLARSARVSEGRMGKLWDRLDGSDIAAAQDIVASFFESGRKTRRRT